jgi:molybdate transport system substrate-binding protein
MLKLALISSAAIALLTPLHAETIKVLTAGAFKAVISEIIPSFEKETGHKIVLDGDTVGGLSKRITGGEAFDFVIGTPNSLAALAKEGFVVNDSVKPVARVGIGIAMKTGITLPPLKTVDDFKAALLAAKKITYIDPAAGGSSGIYTDKLLRDLGIYEQLKDKLLLAKGGYVAEAVNEGKADIAIHQISEILPVKGVVLAAPLPDAIQNYTTYAVGIGAKSDKQAIAKQFSDAIYTENNAKIIAQKGMTALK